MRGGKELNGVHHPLAPPALGRVRERRGVRCCLKGHSISVIHNTTICNKNIIFWQQKSTRRQTYFSYTHCTVHDYVYYGALAIDV